MNYRDVKLRSKGNKKPSLLHENSRIKICTPHLYPILSIKHGCTINHTKCILLEVFKILTLVVF